MTKHEIAFDPTKSKVSPHQLAAWFRAPITGDLQEVPGIGPHAVEKLAEATPKIETTHQLIGHYLALKGKDVDAKAHAQAFYNDMQARGLDAHRAAVVDAVASKTAIFVPGIYDAMEYSTYKAEHETIVAEHATKKHAAGESESAGAAAAATAPTN